MNLLKVARRKPIKLVFQYLSQTTQRMTLLDNVRHGHTMPSKVLGVLDAVEFTESDDSDIEVIGPFPVTTGPKLNGGRKQIVAATQREALKPIHPLFLQNAQAPSQKSIIKPLEKKVSLIACPNPALSLQTRATSIAGPSKHSGTKKPKTLPSKLPLYTYKDYTKPKSCLVFTRDETEANDLIASLKAGPLALDMEWRFLYSQKGHAIRSLEHRTAVVQVADTAGLMLVIQIYHMPRFPRLLQALIENPDIPKMGVNILNDGRKLFKDYGILAKNLVELGALAKVADPHGSAERRIVSLAKLVEQYTSKILEKGKERTSNWEGQLNQKQLEYAANDVHSTVTIYNRLLSLAQQNDIAFDDATLKSCSENVKINISPATDSPSSSQPSFVPPSRSSSNSSTNSSTLTSTYEQSDGSQTESQSSASQLSARPMIRPQHLRAYRCWHQQSMSMDEMQTTLSLKGKGTVEGTLGEGLKAGTVISYVIGALQADSKLPFDVKKLRELVQMDATSWERHREWILRVRAERVPVGHCSEEWL